MTDIRVLAIETYRRISGLQPGKRNSRRYRSRRSAGSEGETHESVPFGGGRDPSVVGSILDTLTSDLGWDGDLSRSALIESWSDIVGRENASHARPVGIENGVLRVNCDSTAWATQLRIMRSSVLTRIAREFPEAGVESIVFHGPGSPHWGKGYRSAGGRGPRDTYG